MSAASEASLHTYKACLGPEDVNRIVQSCVFLSEYLYLPRTVSPEPHLDEVAQRSVIRRLEELNDIGAIRFWEIEGQSDFLKRSQPQLTQFSFPAHEVIPVEVYRELYGEITERLVQNRQYFLGTAMAESLDGIAEFVLGKHALWTVALNEYLRTKRILFDPIAATNATRFFTGILSHHVTADAVVSKVMNRLSIPDVTLLTAEQIAKCRTFLPAFRKDVEARVAEAASSPQFQEEQIAEKIAKQIMDEFFDVVQHNMSVRQALRVIAWRLGRLVLSPVITKEHAARFFGWRDNPAPRPPVLVLLEVKRMLSERGPFSPKRPTS